MGDKDVFSTLKEHVEGYDTYVDEAKEWLERNQERVSRLFEDGRLRDFVFEPVKGVFDIPGTDENARTRTVITTVAIVNAVLAGLPGKMGVGVCVSMALEAWMAYEIARLVGIRIERPSDIWRYFSMLAAAIGTILCGVRFLLGFAFAAFSVIPFVNPLIFAELAVTDLVGVLFVVGFREARGREGFAIPLRALNSVVSETKDLVGHQQSMIQHGLSPRNLQLMGRRLMAWLNGDIIVEKSKLRGEIFTTVAMAYLLGGRTSSLEGPLGQEFLGAIRDRFPELAQASLDEITEHMSAYDAEQLAGVTNMIKGKLFERLVARHENEDGDVWTADLHEDESFPGSDITLENADTGELIEISLKATGDPGYIEHTLSRYPDIPVLTTEEVGGLFEDNPMVMGDSLSNEDLSRVTQENFDAMLSRLDPAAALDATAGGVAVGSLASLWPFVAAYLRERISYDQLVEAFQHVLGESGVALASRVSYAVILGPVFAWYLLARGVMGISNAAQRRDSSPRRLVLQVSGTQPAGPSDSLRSAAVRP